MPPAPTVQFRFHPKSKFRQRSEIQTAAFKAVLRARKSGIIILPCGGGKTALIAELAMILAAMSETSGQAQRALFLCFESQGVLQTAAVLRDHTTIRPHHICVQTGRQKDPPHPNFCFMVTTYAMFSSMTEARSEGSKAARDYVLNKHWNIVVCDEVHHACAPTYEPFLKKLKEHADVMLGATATLYRNESQVKETREEHEKRLFGWFGPVLYRCSASESERAGLVAKIRRAEVRVSLTDEFAAAHEAVKDFTEKQYLAALNPQKLNALACICGMHTRMGHTGIVFATHLLTAKVLRDVLGEGWEILSGSNAHGVDEKHSAEANREIVKRFNAGELAGIISTAVGESSLDLHCTAFRYVVVLDADGGSASAAQKLGRAARTPRVDPKEGETQEQLRARRLAQQKSAAYYEINTRRTADIASAKRRVAEFEVEGYPDTVRVPYEDLVAWAAEEQFALPFAELLHDMRLLKEILTYSALANQVAAAKAAAAGIKKPQKDAMRKNAEASNSAGTKVMRELAKKRCEKLQAQQSVVDERARQEKQRVLDAAQLPPAAMKLFMALGLPLDVLMALGVEDQVLMPPSDDEGEAL